MQRNLIFLDITETMIAPVIRGKNEISINFFLRMITTISPMLFHMSHWHDIIPYALN